MSVIEDRIAVLEAEHARIEDMLSAHISSLAVRLDVISEGQQKMVQALLALQDRIARLERAEAADRGCEPGEAVVKLWSQIQRREMS